MTSVFQDRMWRKNRGRNSGSSCVGTDLNRNFDFHWGEIGVSHNPCSEIYCGRQAFDCPETANIRNYVGTLDPVPLLGHSIHSYSQLWLWPYAFDDEARPDNWREIVRSPKIVPSALSFANFQNLILIASFSRGCH